MNSSPPLPDPIQWHEGMLLTPQHFQQAWLRQDGLQAYHMMRLSPTSYGVRRLTLDAAMLVVGVFRILDVEAVLPDGLVVSHSAGNGGDLQVSLLPHADRLKAEPFTTVHLVVPAARPGGAVSGDLARYRSVEAPPVVDENTGDNEQIIPRLRPSLSLLVGDEVPQKYVSLPIARVTYSNESYHTVEYVPPQVATPLDSVLAEACRGIARRLREKAMFLAGRLRTPTGALQAPLVMETRHSVQCLVAGLPRLEAVLAAASHPLALYTELCGIAGSVASLSAGLVPPIFDPYDHHDILGSVRPVIDFVGRAIDTVSESNVRNRFVGEDDGFSLKIDPAWLDGHGLVVGVRVPPGRVEDEIEAWMMEAAIASAEHIDGLRLRRLRGVPRQRIERDERLELLPDRGVLLYRITAERSLVVGGAVLKIVSPGDRSGVRRPAEIVLFVAPPGGSSSGAGRGGAGA